MKKMLKKVFKNEKYPFISGIAAGAVIGLIILATPIWPKCAYTWSYDHSCYCEGYYESAGERPAHDHEGNCKK